MQHSTDLDAGSLCRARAPLEPQSILPCHVSSICVLFVMLGDSLHSAGAALCQRSMSFLCRARAKRGRGRSNPLLYFTLLLCWFFLLVPCGPVPVSCALNDIRLYLSLRTMNNLFIMSQLRKRHENTTVPALLAGPSVHSSSSVRPSLCRAALPWRDDWTLVTTLAQRFLSSFPAASRCATNKDILVGIVNQYFWTVPCFSDR